MKWSFWNKQTNKNENTIEKNTNHIEVYITQKWETTKKKFQLLLSQFLSPISFTAIQTRSLLLERQQVLAINSSADKKDTNRGTKGKRTEQR